MKKFFNRFLTFGLSIAMLFGFITSNPLPQPTVTAEAATTADSYYSGITATSSTQLLGQLHDLITSTHKKYTSYDNCRDNAQKTDPGPDGKGVMEFYTHESITTYVGDKDAAGSWNREHVWPQSLSGGLWKTSGAGSDMHHIRPSEKSMNGTRGNDLYGNVTGGTAVWSKTSSGANSKIGGYSKSGVFMPSDVSKGDAARIVMYVYTHYNTYSNSSVFGSYATTNGNGSASFGNLPIRNVVSASSDKAAFDILLEWNKEDPVDEIERTRNEEVYKIQGNRNPFIDHPEYASAIWGDGAVDPNPGGQGGQGGGTTEEAGKFTITLNSFDLVDNYDFQSWTAGGVSGIAYIFGGNEKYPPEQGMQFSKEKDGYSYYLANTTAVPGAITSVKLVANGNYAEEWSVLTSDTSFGQVTGRPSGGTNQGKKEVSTSGATWNISGDDTYFAVTYDTTGFTGYLASIEVTYETDTPTPPPVTDTDQEKVNAALSSLQASRTIDKTTTLETKSGEVNLAWTKTSPATLPNGITFSGNTLTVTDDRPTTDTIITFNVTASLNGKSGTKPVTITVKGKTGTVTPPTPGETKTLTITIDSFDGATGGYAFYDWTADGVSGIAYIHANTTDKMQFASKQDSHYLASTSATSGPITKVTVTAAQDTKDWELLTSTTAYGEIKGGNPSTGTNQGTKSVSTKGATWTVSGNDTYFALVYKGSGAAYLSSIEITYGSSSQTVDPDKADREAVTAALATLSDQTVEATTQLKTSEGNVQFTWTTDTQLPPGITFANNTLTVTNRPETDTPIVFTVMAKLNNVTQTKTVTITVKAKSVTPPDPTKNDGTAAKPYTVAEVNELGKSLGKGEFYKVNGVEKEIYVKGYVTDIGKIFQEYGLSSVMIADEKGGTTTLLLYSVNWGEAMEKPNPVPTDSPLKAGDYIVIHGFLTYFYDNKAQEGKLEIDKNSAKDTFPMFSTWQRDGKDVGTEPVEPELSGITVSPDTLELTVGGTKNTSDFTVTAQPAGATLPVLTWTVTVEGIVKIENGVITALTAGQTAIKIKAGDFEATINVTVKASDTTAEDTAKVQAALDKLTDETIEASKTLATNDGDVQLTWTLKTEDLPEGIKFENNTISFTELPAEQTVLIFEVKATLNNVEQTKTITITIQAKPVTPPDPSVEANAKIAAAKAAIENGTVTFQKEFTEPNTTGVDLPATYEGTTLTWALQGTSEYVKVENGKLIVTTLPENDLTLTLVATISCEHGTSQTANVTITVKAKPVTPPPVDPDKEDREAVQAALAKLNDETVNANKTFAANDGDVQFTWTLKTETELPKGIKFADNTLTITELPDAETVLTFEVKATLGNVTETKTVKVTVEAKIFVPDPDEADRETVTKALATLSDETVEKTTELKTSEGTVQFTWTTETELPAGITFANNKITITELPETETAIVFTVTAKLNNVTETKTVTVTVKAKPITPPPVDPDKEDREAVTAALGEQTDRSVDKSTRFKTKDGEVELSWTTETALPAGITFSGDTLTITARPAEDFDIVFTVTAKLNNVTQSKQVTITVKAAVPDEAKVQAFHDAVAGIPTEGTPAARLTAIRNALNAYNALTDAEKLLAAEDYAALQAAVKSYNESVRSYNDAAKNAESGALSGIIG